MSAGEHFRDLKFLENAGKATSSPGHPGTGRIRRLHPLPTHQPSWVMPRHQKTDGRGRSQAALRAHCEQSRERVLILSQSCSELQPCRPGIHRHGFVLSTGPCRPGRFASCVGPLRNPLTLNRTSIHPQSVTLRFLRFRYGHQLTSSVLGTFVASRNCFCGCKAGYLTGYPD